MPDINMPAPRVPLLDVRTGTLTREWFQFLAGLGSAIADGNKGDVTVSGNGTVISINAGAVGLAELGGDITAAGEALLDDADAAAQRTTLGIDASTIPFTEGDISDWDGNVNMDFVAPALDQLARRAQDLEEIVGADASLYVAVAKWGID